ncbi:MAG: 6-bladed beta-propeller [Acidobacteria bacterium]|nr:6-bladed beta-propeller [Acidobacteriota bacterium]
MNLRLIVILLALLVAVACSEPLEFADWTIPVPEGTRIIEYAAVPIEDREGSHIELVEDLVIEERQADANYRFFRPLDLAVDQLGRIYVLDAGNNRVQVFDENGVYLRTIGREGQGPGEMNRPQSLAVVGTRLAVTDMGNSRLGVWTLEGEIVGSFVFSQRKMARTLAASVDGGLVVSSPEFTSDGTKQSVSRMELDGSEDPVYPTLPHSPPRRVARVDANGLPAPGVSTQLGSYVPQHAVGRTGIVYVTASDEYQVLALRPDATALWALRVAWQRPPVTSGQIDKDLERIRQRVPDVGRGEIEWPARHRALAGIRTDSHGHLFVFPFDPSPASSDVVAVDVYSDDGAQLFSGLMPNLMWVAALNDHVYVIEPNESTGESRVVRYRLVEPF